MPDAKSNAKISVAIVEPLYQVNLGYIARAMKNFGVEKLYLINPRCKPLGAKAIMYSKHARDILENAKKVGSISAAKAASGSNIVVGTTGIWEKSERSFYNIYTPNAFAKSYKNARSILLLLGRDDIGLLGKEMEECDAVVTIPTSKAYPVLNVSHALAILLYALLPINPGYSAAGMLATSRTKKSVNMLFRELVYSNKRIRNKEAVMMAFSHIISRSMPTEKELRALAVALSRK